MGKAARDHTPDTAPEQPPLDADAHWLAIEAAHRQRAERTRDNQLATIDLMELLAQGRLPCMLRSTLTGERTRVAATAWNDQIKLDAIRDSVRVIYREPLYRLKGQHILNPVRGAHFYVWQPVLDRIWSADDDDGDAPPRVRPGPKPTGDWPKLVEAWIASVEKDEPNRLRNVDALVVDAQDFLRKEIKWAPSDTKALRQGDRRHLAQASSIGCGTHPELTLNLPRCHGVNRHPRFFPKPRATRCLPPAMKAPLPA